MYQIYFANLHLVFVHSVVLPNDIQSQFAIHQDASESDSCSPLQILFDFSSVRSIESLEFLVEFHVTLIDVINVSIFIKRPASAVLGSLINPVRNIFISTCSLVINIQFLISIQNYIPYLAYTVHLSCPPLTSGIFIK